MSKFRVGDVVRVSSCGTAGFVPSELRGAIGIVTVPEYPAVQSVWVGIVFPESRFKWLHMLHGATRRGHGWYVVVDNVERAA